jgi:hypothetical protein
MDFVARHNLPNAPARVAAMKPGLAGNGGMERIVPGKVVDGKNFPAERPVQATFFQPFYAGQTLASASSITDSAMQMSDW